MIWCQDARHGPEPSLLKSSRLKWSSSKGFCHRQAEESVQSGITVRTAVGFFWATHQARGLLWRRHCTDRLHD